MEVDSGADSVSSTPRAAQSKLGGEDRSVVRLMCSFGGQILPRPHDNQLRYVGGDTRIVAVHRTTAYAALVSKLSKLLNNSGDFTVKYQLPNEDLDALITVSSDEDVENMMEEFERLSFQQNNTNTNRVPRLRLFLFPNTTGVEGSDTSRTSSIASLLDGSRKRENWFLDALNGGAAGRSLERKRSEASSIVSEVPDYLFGLDNSDDTSTKLRSRTGLGDGVPGSDPSSPAFGSSSSASHLPVLPPVKTKLDDPNPVEVGDTHPQLAGGHVWGHGSNPGSPYPAHQAVLPVLPPLKTKLENPNAVEAWGHGSNQGSPYPAHHAAVQTIPVYYVQAGPGQGLVPQRNSHLQPVPVPVQVQVPVPNPGYVVHQYGQNPVQVPVGYPGTGPVYGMDQFNMGPGQGQGPGPNGAGQPLYYGVKNTGMVASYPGMVVPVAGEDVAGSGSDPSKGRIQ